MMRRFLLLIVILGTGVFVASCDKPRLTDQNSEIEGHTWKMNDKKTFDFTVPDTTTLYNFYVNLRNADDYPYSNIIFYIHTDFPNGKSHLDTLECFLTDAEGRWLGKGQGDVWDNQIGFKTGMRFPLAGNYKMSIMQGMRKDLTGVYNVGLRIEKFEKKN